MYPLLESIRCRDGKFDLLASHQARLDHSMRKLYPDASPWQLKGLLKKKIRPKEGLWKCRFLYGPAGYEIQFVKYRPKTIARLIVKERPGLQYPFKFSDRAELHSLMIGLEERTEVIIAAGGRIKDSSYANLALWDGEHWHTPMYPLLYGVRRASLLDSGHLKETDIHLKDLDRFRAVRLINSMLPLEEAPEISMENVVVANEGNAHFR